MMGKMSALNISARLKVINIPEPKREIHKREKEVCDTISGLARRIEDAASSEIIEEEEVFPLHSEFEEEAVETYEPLIHKTTNNIEFFTYEYMESVIDFVDSAKNRSFKSVQHQFRRFKQQHYISRFRTYIGNLGTAREKYKMIAQCV